MRHLAVLRSLSLLGFCVVYSVASAADSSTSHERTSRAPTPAAHSTAASRPGAFDFRAERAWINGLDPWSALQASDLRTESLLARYAELREMLESAQRRSAELAWTHATGVGGELGREAALIDLRVSALGWLLPRLADELTESRQQLAEFRARARAGSAGALAACDSAVKDLSGLGARLGMAPLDVARSLMATQATRLADNRERLDTEFRELHRAAIERALVDGERELSHDPDFAGRAGALGARGAVRSAEALEALRAQKSELADLAKTFTTLGAHEVRASETGQSPTLRCYFVAPAESSNALGGASRAPAIDLPPSEPGQVFPPHSSPRGSRVDVAI